MDLAIATMDRLDIGSALLSVSAPERHFGDDTVTRELARQVNEAGAKRHAHGLLASLPLPMSMEMNCPLKVPHLTRAQSTDDIEFNGPFSLK